MPPVRMATGLVASDAGVDAFAEAASRAQLGLGGAPADLVAVFAGGPNLESAEDGLAAVEGRLGGGGAEGVGGEGGGGRGTRARAGWRRGVGGVARRGRGSELPPRAARDGRRRPRDRGP